MVISLGPLGWVAKASAIIVEPESGSAASLPGIMVGGLKVKIVEY